MAEELEAAPSPRREGGRDPADRRGRRRRVRAGRRESVTSTDAIPEGWLGLDIGPETRTRFAGADRDRTHRVLERADGGLRVAPLRRRERRRLPRPSRPAPGSPSSAAATRYERSRSSVSRERIGWVSTGGGASLELPRRAGSFPAWPRSPRPQMPDGVAGNWKMFKGPLETAEFCRLLTDGLREPARASRGRLPAYVSLRPRWTRSLAPASRSSRRTRTGARRAPSPARSRRGCSPSSASPGRSSGTRSGGSYFGETDETVARRTAHALDAGPRRHRVCRRDAGRSGRRRDRVTSCVARSGRSPRPPGRTSAS